VAGQRRRELGIRLALGASRLRIEREVLTGGLVVAGVGVAVGLLGAWLTGRYLESRLWGVEAGDPLTLAVSGALLLATAAVASWLPARRAGRTDPLETLRVE
jgi:ABC-type antimicrobial peptide transport system permease subunit